MKTQTLEEIEGRLLDGTMGVCSHINVCALVSILFDHEERLSAMADSTGVTEDAVESAIKQLENMVAEDGGAKSDDDSVRVKDARAATVLIAHVRNLTQQAAEHAQAVRERDEARKQAEEAKARVFPGAHREKLEKLTRYLNDKQYPQIYAGQDVADAALVVIQHFEKQAEEHAQVARELA